MNPLAFFSPYKLLIEIAVIGALALGAVWGVHEFLEHERDIGRAEVQALWDKQVAADKEAARIKTAELAAQAEEAKKNGANREQTIRTLAGASSAANLGLRDVLASTTASVPNATIETLGKSVTTLSSILADCSGRYQDVAEKADRHANDAKTLDEAWPK